ELGEVAQVVDLVVREREVEEVVDDLGEAAGDDVVAVSGEAADGEFEGGFVGHAAGVKEPGGHGELVGGGGEGVHGRVSGTPLGSAGDRNRTRQDENTTEAGPTGQTGDRRLRPCGDWRYGVWATIAPPWDTVVSPRFAE